MADVPASRGLSPVTIPEAKEGVDSEKMKTFQGSPPVSPPVSLPGAKQTRNRPKSNSFDETQGGGSASSGSVTTNTARNSVANKDAFNTMLSSYQRKDFLEQYLSQQKEEWKDSYLNYVKLCEMLENIKHQYVNSEREFSEFLASETDKVNKFYEGLVMELGDVGLFQIAKPASELAANIQVVEDFAVLNVSSLKNIINKHDSISKLRLAPAYMWKMQRDDFVERCLLEPLLQKLSSCYHFDPTTGKRFGTELSATASTTATTVTEDKNASVAFTETEATKITLWVLPRQVIKITLKIMKELPITNTEVFAETHTAIYFDDHDLGVYHSRVAGQKLPIIGIRWQGAVGEQPCSVTTGASSPGVSKEKGQIRHDEIVPFLKNKNTPEMLQNIKNNPELKEVQERIAGELLRPCLKIEYKRTSFELAPSEAPNHEGQKPPNSGIAIHLSTNVNMLRESDHGSGLKDWTTPGGRVQEHSVHRFPFALLTIKATRKPLPKWLNSLIANSCCQRKDAFSKYQHGIAIVFSDRVNQVPEWVTGQFAKEFTSHKHRERQPDASLFRSSQFEFQGAKQKSQADAGVNSSASMSGRRAPARSAGGGVFDVPDRRASQNRPRASTMTAGMRPSFGYGATNRDYGTQDFTRASMYDLRPAFDGRESMYGMQGRRGAKELSSDESEDEPLINNENKSAAAAAAAPAAVVTQPADTKLTRAKVAEEDFLLKIIWCQCCKRPDSQREIEAKDLIRVEPKTFFANERTYMQWFNAAIMLSSVGMALMFQKGMRVIALIFTCMAIAILIYSYGIFHLRLVKLKTRVPTSKYADTRGPCALSSFLTISFIVIMIFTAYFPEGQIDPVQSLRFSSLSSKSMVLVKCLSQGVPPLTFEPEGLAYSPFHGALWGVSSSTVFSVDLMTKEVKYFVPQDAGKLVGKLDAIAVAADGTVYVATSTSSFPQTPQISLLNPTTKNVVRSFGLPGFNSTEPVNTTSPLKTNAAFTSAMTVVQTGGLTHLYVGNARDGKVYIYQLSVDNKLTLRETVAFGSFGSETEGISGLALIPGLGLLLKLKSAQVVSLYQVKEDGLPGNMTQLYPGFDIDDAKAMTSGPADASGIGLLISSPRLHSIFRYSFDQATGVGSCLGYDPVILPL